MKHTLFPEHFTYALTHVKFVGVCVSLPYWAMSSVNMGTQFIHLSIHKWRIGTLEILDRLVWNLTPSPVWR